MRVVTRQLPPEMHGSASAIRAVHQQAERRGYKFAPIRSVPKGLLPIRAAYKHKDGSWLVLHPDGKLSLYERAP